MWSVKRGKRSGKENCIILFGRHKCSKEPAVHGIKENTGNWLRTPFFVLLKKKMLQ